MQDLENFADPFFAVSTGGKCFELHCNEHMENLGVKVCMQNTHYKTCLSKRCFTGILGTRVP